MTVLEEGSVAEVSTQQGDAMGEQEGMHAGEFSRPGSHKEQDDVVASNVDDFVNQTDPEEFSQATDPVYPSPLENPRGNGQGDEAINEQSMRQGVETSASRELLAPKLPRVSLEIEILGEGFGEGKIARKRQTQQGIPTGKRPRTRPVSPKEQESLKSEQSLGQFSTIPTQQQAATTSHQKTPLPHTEKGISEQSQVPNFEVSTS